MRERAMLAGQTTGASRGMDGIVKGGGMHNSSKRWHLIVLVAALPAWCATLKEESKVKLAPQVSSPAGQPCGVGGSTRIVCPVVSMSVSPNTGRPGQILTVKVKGTNTNFAAGATMASFGAGISVGGAAEGSPGPATVSSATDATVQLKIDADAAPGARTIRVQTGAQAVQLSAGFSVLASPVNTQPTADFKIKTLLKSGGTTTYDGYGVAADALGNVYATGSVIPCNGKAGFCSSASVLKKDSSGVTVAAGDSTDEVNPVNCSSTPATSLSLTDLGGLGVDPSGDLYVAQSGNGPVFEVSGGAANFYDKCENFIAGGIAANGPGTVYFSAPQNYFVYAMKSGGVPVPVAGAGVPGCKGENVRALSAQLGGPTGLAIDKTGENLYIADPNCDAVRKVDLASGKITTVAGVLDNKDLPLGDGGPATGARLFQPNGVAVDTRGNLYIADTADDLIRQVNSNGIINTIAGTGTGGFSGDGGPATGAEFNWPYSVAVAPNGNVYVGDHSNQRIRELTPNVRPTTGTVPYDFVGDGYAGALGYESASGLSFTALSDGNGKYQYVPNSYADGFDTAVTGDFNGDGKADLILYSSKSGAGDIGLGIGDGTFTFQALNWAAGYTLIALGDINGDGKTDVALYNPVSGKLYIGLNNGDGTFTYKEQTPVENAGYTFVGLGDTTGDGKADLIVYSASTTQGFIGLSKGNGTFSFQALSWPAGDDKIALGDINGDGKNDVALYDSASGSLYTGISNGDGTFSYTGYPLDRGYTYVGLCNCSGNGKADLILYNASPKASSSIGVNNGAGSFDFRSLPWGSGYDNIVLEDVEGNGEDDVVLYNSLTGIEATGISNGNGAFTYAKGQFWGIGKILARYGP